MVSVNDFHGAGKANQAAIAKVKETIDLARTIYNRDFPYPVVTWSLKSALQAGRARCSENIVELNKEFYRGVGEEFINSTVPHEVVHIIAYILSGYRVSGHGPMWKSVMVRLGLPPVTGHSFCVHIAEGPQRTIEYRCSCQVWQFTTRRHAKVLKGDKYSCPKCKGIIVKL